MKILAVKNEKRDSCGSRIELEKQPKSFKTIAGSSSDILPEFITNVELLAFM
jgi:hypothetical protein